MSFGIIGQAAALGLAAIGSALGCGTAAQGAVGAWKKALATNKAPSMLLAAFVGFPLSQTLYGFLVMLVVVPSKTGDMKQLAAGVFGGLAIGMSAWLQGIAAAGACDAQQETGKGTAQYVLALGIVESVAILVLAFLFLI
ncbi:MAG: V-type ATP synthase subunit K [Spirochaetales bacterium]|nr:V-type ATP synthase subunit K [Spirochaetales bacterium]